MAKLYLKFDQKILREYPLSDGLVTIGRAPDNTILINDLTVSGHHATIQWKAWRYVLQDKNSLNGTSVNGTRIETSDLNNGDLVLIGRHTLLFENKVQETTESQGAEPTSLPAAFEGAEVRLTTPPPVLSEPEPQKPAPEPPLVKPPAFEPTVFQTPKAPVAPKPRERVGQLRVIEGELEESEYALYSILTVIGKSDTARIKLKGWFAPKVAANIARRNGKYIISSGDKGVRLKINGEPTLAQRELQEYDTIEVAGLTFSFTYRD